MSTGTAIKSSQDAVTRGDLATVTADSSRQVRKQRGFGTNTFKSAVTVIVALFLTCAIAECLARFLACMTVPADGKDRAFDAKMLLATQLADNKEPAVIFIGNSISNQGIYADLVEERLRQKGLALKVVNLATTGSCIQEKLELLNAACTPKSGPRLVVFQISPAELEQELAQNSAPTSEFFNSYVGRNSKFRPASMPLSFWDKCFNSLDQYSYLSRYRKHWCQYLHSAINYITNPEASRSRGPIPYVHSQVSLAGWSPWYGFVSDQDLDRYTQTSWRDFTEKTGKLPTRKWLWDFSNIEIMRDFCNAHKLPLTALWMPELADKTILYSGKNITPEECTAKVAPWLTLNNIDFIDLRKANLERTDFSTWNHHNALGAVHISEILAQRLSDFQFAKQFGKK